MPYRVAQCCRGRAFGPAGCDLPPWCWAVMIGSGLLIWGVKGVRGTLSQPLFHIKITLVLAMVVLSSSALGFRRWLRTCAAPGALPPAAEVARVRRLVMIQSHVLPVVAVIASVLGARLVVDIFPIKSPPGWSRRAFAIGPWRDGAPGVNFFTSSRHSLAEGLALVALERLGLGVGVAGFHLVLLVAGLLLRQVFAEGLALVAFMSPASLLQVAIFDCCLVGAWRLRRRERPKPNGEGWPSAVREKKVSMESPGVDGYAAAGALHHRTRGRQREQVTTT